MTLQGSHQTFEKRSLTWTQIYLASFGILQEILPGEENDN